MTYGWNPGRDDPPYEDDAAPAGRHHGAGPYSRHGSYGEWGGDHYGPADDSAAPDSVYYGDPAAVHERPQSQGPPAPEVGSHWADHHPYRRPPSHQRPVRQDDAGYGPRATVNRNEYPAGRPGAEPAGGGSGYAGPGHGAPGYGAPGGGGRTGYAPGYEPYGEAGAGGGQGYAGPGYGAPGGGGRTGYAPGYEPYGELSPGAGPDGGRRDYAARPGHPPGYPPATPHPRDHQPPAGGGIHQAEGGGLLAGEVRGLNTRVPASAGYADGYEAPTAPQPAIPQAPYQLPGDRPNGLSAPSPSATYAAPVYLESRRPAYGYEASGQGDVITFGQRPGDANTGSYGPYRTAALAASNGAAHADASGYLDLDDRFQQDEPEFLLGGPSSTGLKPSRAQRGSRAAPRRRHRGRLWLTVVSMLMAAAAAATLVGMKGRLGYSPRRARVAAPAHLLLTPQKIGRYLRDQRAEEQFGLSHGEQYLTQLEPGHISRIVAAVYDVGGPVSSPYHVAFIGGRVGNLRADVVKSFTQQETAEGNSPLKVPAGPLGGRAACAGKGRSGICVWADRDTVGVVVSATLSARSLSRLMLTIRSAAEIPSA